MYLITNKRKETDMYILVKKSDVNNADILAAYHTELEDGRIVITPQELKIMGSVPNCQVVATKAELDVIMAECKPVETTGETAETRADSDIGTDTETVGETAENTATENIEDGKEANDGNEGSIVI